MAKATQETVGKAAIKEDAERAPLKVEAQYVNIGKVPGGEIKEVQLNGRLTARELFKKIGVENFEGCDLQRNGKQMDLDDVAQAGDTILAVTKIRGN